MVSEEMKNYSTFVLRLFLGLGFLVAGLDKLFHLEGATGIFQDLLGAGWLVWVALIIEIVGGIFLLVGYETRKSAAVLGALIIIAFITTFNVTSGDFISVLREIMVMNTAGGNVPANFMYLGALLSLALSGSSFKAVKPD